MSATEDYALPTTASVGGSLNTTAEVDPFEYYERVREAGDVVWDEGLNAWLVSSFELVKEMSRQDQIIWRAPLVLDPEHPPLGLTIEECVAFVGRGSRRNMGMSEGALHDHQHRWWLRTFSPRVLNHWREKFIRPIAHAQINQFVEQGHAELGRDFSDLVAPRVVAAVMGLPTDDEFIAELERCTRRRGMLKQRVDLNVQAAGESRADRHPDPELVRSALDATTDMHDLLRPHIMERKSGEGDDFLSMVWRDAANTFGTDDITDHDVCALAENAWDAATGTTTYSTSNGLYILLTRPEVRKHVAAGDDKVVKLFVEETLRLYGPVVFRPRIAKVDTDIAGVRIKAGETVIALTAAANRDATKHACPAMVDTNRPAPRDHFAFWQGTRVCPGQGLARIELEEIAKVVLQRLPDMRLDPGAEPRRYTKLVMRRWEPLNVVFTPGAPSA